VLLQTLERDVSLLRALDTAAGNKAASSLATIKKCLRAKGEWGPSAVFVVNGLLVVGGLLVCSTYGEWAPLVKYL
jgi:hypothetical protein